MGSDDADIDAIAAALRSDAGDLRVYMNVLAAKLEAALPGMVEVDRRRDGLFGPRTVVQRLTVTCEDTRFVLEPGNGGTLRATRSKVVRGIVLDRDELRLDEWVTALSASLAQLARTTERGREALGRLLA